jgi:hypothetical protein
MQRYLRLVSATLAVAVDEDRAVMRTTRLLCATVAVVLMGLGAASAQTYKMTTPIAPGVVIL